MFMEHLISMTIEAKSKLLENALRFEIEEFITSKYNKGFNDRLSPDEVAETYLHFITKKY